MTPSTIARFTQKTLVKGGIVVILVAFAAVAVLPSYWSGSWPWLNPPEVAQLSSLRAIRSEGLTPPDWQSDFQEEATFGGRKWSVQQFTTPPLTGLPEIDNGQVKQVLLILRTQGQSKDQPEVEWVDIKGAQQWTTDSYQRVQLLSTDADGPTFKAKANFFRAWNQQQTYAALQWYAWPGGGHPSPSQWFWVDQTYQWRHHQRLPWVAVNLLLPIEPIGDVSAYEAAMLQWGQTIQSSLQMNVFIQ